MSTPRPRPTPTRGLTGTSRHSHPPSKPNHSLHSRARRPNRGDHDRLLRRGGTAHSLRECLRGDALSALRHRRRRICHRAVHRYDQRARRVDRHLRTHRATPPDRPARRGHPGRSAHHATARRLPTLAWRIGRLTQAATNEITPDAVCPGAPSGCGFKGPTPARLGAHGVVAFEEQRPPPSTEPRATNLGNPARWCAAAIRAAGFNGAQSPRHIGDAAAAHRLQDPEQEASTEPRPVDLGDGGKQYALIREALELQRSPGP